MRAGCLAPCGPAACVPLWGPLRAPCIQGGGRVYCRMQGARAASWCPGPTHYGIWLGASRPQIVRHLQYLLPHLVLGLIHGYKQGGSRIASCVTYSAQAQLAAASRARVRAQAGQVAQQRPGCSRSVAGLYKTTRGSSDTYGALKRAQSRRWVLLRPTRRALGEFARQRSIQFSPRVAKD